MSRIYMDHNAEIPNICVCCARGNLQAGLDLYFHVPFEPYSGLIRELDDAVLCAQQTAPTEDEREVQQRGAREAPQDGAEAAPRQSTSANPR